MAGKNGSNSPEHEDHISNAVPVDVMRLVRDVGIRLWFTRFLAGLNDGLVIGLLIMLAYLLVAIWDFLPYAVSDCIGLFVYYFASDAEGGSARRRRSSGEPFFATPGAGRVKAVNVPIRAFSAKFCCERSRDNCFFH